MEFKLPVSYSLLEAPIVFLAATGMFALCCLNGHRLLLASVADCSGLPLLPMQKVSSPQPWWVSVDLAKSSC